MGRALTARAFGAIALSGMARGASSPSRAHEISDMITLYYSASDQVVSEHGPVEKVLRFSSLEPRSAHPETTLF